MLTTGSLRPVRPRVRKTGFRFFCEISRGGSDSAQPERNAVPAIPAVPVFRNSLLEMNPRFFITAPSFPHIWIYKKTPAFSGVSEKSG